MSGGDDIAPAGPREPASPSPLAGRSRGEKIFLAAVITVTLLAAILFLGLTAWDIFIPAMGTAILTGIGVATLVYAFLGGRGDDSFKVRGMQLAGAAAVFAIVVYIVNGSLDGQLKNSALIETGRKAQTRIKGANERAEKAEDERDEARLALRRRGQSVERDIVAEVRSATADDNLGKAVLAMWTAREGPFARTVGDEDVTARFDGRVADGGFEYCHSKWPRFTARIIRFNPRDAEATGEITLTPGADIGPVCHRTQMSYSVRLGCDAARVLIPDRIEGCTAQGVLWREGASREINLFAVIINPITR